MSSSAPQIVVARTAEGLQCGWAGCPVILPDEIGWIKHVSVHVFTLKPGERTPWLGPPELDPERQRVDGMFFAYLASYDLILTTETLATLADEQSDGGGEDDEDEDDRAFSQINALSSPASTPPQVGLPDSPDFSEKINGPSTSAATEVEPLRLLRSPGQLERVLSHQTSASADDVEAELIPTSPTPSINATQSVNSNPEGSQSPHHLSHGSPAPSQPQLQRPVVNRFRHGTFQVRYSAPTQTPLRFGFGLGSLYSQSRLAASQTLRSPDDSQANASNSQSQTNGNGLSWLNTQAFRPPETQDSYESD